MRPSGRSASLVYWAMVLAYALLIFWLSSLESDQIPSVFGLVWDKLLHGASFAVLSFLFLLAANRGLHRPLRPALMVAAVLFTVTYGALDEWHQTAVATRIPSAADLLADAVGAVAALPVYVWLAGKLTRRADS